MTAARKFLASFVETCWDAPEVLEFTEVTFDDIAFLIEYRIDCALDFAIPLCGNVSVATTLADQIHNGLSIATAVSQKGLGACRSKAPANERRANTDVRQGWSPRVLTASDRPSRREF